MTRLPHSAFAWLANALVPGAGLVLMGRLVAGVALSVAWAAALCGFLVVTLVWPGVIPGNGVVGLGIGAAAVYVVGQAAHAIARRKAEHRLAGQERDERFKAVLVATLEGRLDEAERLCRALLREDPDDVEATLHLGSLARRCGRVPDARKYLARARYLDTEGRWDSFIGREFAALAAPGDQPGA